MNELIANIGGLVIHLGVKRQSFLDVTWRQTMNIIHNNILQLSDTIWQNTSGILERPVKIFGR